MRYRNSLKEELKKKIIEDIGMKKHIRSNVKKLADKYSFPVNISNDYLTMRTNIENASDFELFCITSVLLKDYKIEHYFTEREIKEYEGKQYEIEKIKGNIQFDVIEIERDGQWTGRISTDFLMQLRDAQLISYNPETQRTMERIVKNEKEIYRISLNQRALREIMYLIENGDFVSNTLTLNMPLDTNYSYDEEDRKLTIRNISHFDILDGYHRYMAISNLKNLNKEIGIDNMEIRITRFPESRAKQFIFQENQRNKLKKIDSDSLNQNRHSNKVIYNLNVDKEFQLSKLISRNDGIISSGVFSEIIEVAYFYKVKKLDTASRLEFKVYEELKNKINVLCFEDFTLKEKPWSKYFTIAAVVCCKIDIPQSKLLASIKEMADKAEKENIMGSRGKITRPDYLKFVSLL